ncbi:MAG: hypothetical protein KGL39_06160 [Patescibacteria group bacterium]|nr:hypothetical protein [Patescibacteria group bacterium]
MYIPPHIGSCVQAREEIERLRAALGSGYHGDPAVIEANARLIAAAPMAVNWKIQAKAAEYDRLKAREAVPFTPKQIDCGADALRRHEQGGKMLRDWEDLPSGVKRKWREKAEVVISAAERQANE